MIASDTSIETSGGCVVSWGYRGTGDAFIDTRVNGNTRGTYDIPAEIFSELRRLTYRRDDIEKIRAETLYWARGESRRKAVAPFPPVAPPRTPQERPAPRRLPRTAQKFTGAAKRDVGWRRCRSL